MRSMTESRERAKARPLSERKRFNLTPPGFAAQALQAANLHGVVFLILPRDLTACGFWSYKMGLADLAYTGNTECFQRVVAAIHHR